MPGFDISKFLFAVAMIGICAGLLMWGYDQIAGPFNELVATGKVSHIAVQSMDMIRYGVILYAPISLLFTAVHAFLVANARAETNSPLITTDISGPLIYAAVAIGAMLAEYFVSAFVDQMIISQMGDLAASSGVFSVPTVMSQAFSAVHILCPGAIAVAILYMAILSFKVESLQWSA